MVEIKKRKRPSYLCENCRKRKVKCDKEQPCFQCNKLGKVGTCFYANKDADRSPKPSLPYLTSAKNPILFNTTPSVDNTTTNGKHSSKYGPRLNEVISKANSTSNSTSFNSNSSGSNVSKDDTPNELDALKQRLKFLEDSLITNKVFANANNNDSTRPQPSQFSSNPTSQLQNNSITSSDHRFSENGRGDGTRLPSIASSSAGSHIIQPEFGSNPSGSDSPSSLQFSPGFFNYAKSHSPPKLTERQPGFLTNEGTSSKNEKSPDNQSHRLPSFVEVTGSMIDLFQGDLTSTNSQPNNGKAAVDINSVNGINPYGSPDDTINFYEGYTSVHTKGKYRRINFGPFAWSSLMRKDAGLNLLWNYTSKKKEASSKDVMVFSGKDDKDLYPESQRGFTSNGTEDLTAPSENMFRKRALQPEGIDDIIPYRLMKLMSNEELNQRKHTSTGVNFGVSCRGSLKEEFELINQIKILLPKRKVVWKLIDRFFYFMYPFFPFIDEESFRHSTTTMIGECQYVDEDIKELKIEKKLDLCYLGILLIMLRLGYLSLFCNRNDINEFRMLNNHPSPEAQTYRYLYANPITINFVSLAEKCLNQFNMFRQPSLPILQLAFYIMLYHKYAPEDGDGADGGDSVTLLSMLIQMAVSLGLHREPENFPELAGDLKTNHVGRKIWHYLIMNDVYYSSMIGTSLSIDKTSYDTKVPFNKDGGENLLNVELDRYITDKLFSSNFVASPFRRILDKILTVEGRVSMAELCGLLNEFELGIVKEFGTVKDCLQNTVREGLIDHFETALSLKFYLSLKAFLIIVYYYFYLYYEPKDSTMSFFYIKKILLISVGDIMASYFDFIGCINCDMVINPTLEAFIHKSNQVLFALNIRVNFIIYSCKMTSDFKKKWSTCNQYLEYFNSLCRLSTSLTKCLEVSIAVISKLSNRYYYAWRISKGHSYLLKVITRQEFYEENYETAGGLCSPLYTSKQLDELNNICETTLNTLGKAESTIVSPGMVANLKDSRKADSYSANTSDTVPTFSPSNSNGYSSTSMPKTPLVNINGNNSIDMFNLDFVDDSQIDKLWLEMLTTRQDADTNLIDIEDSLFLNNNSNDTGNPSDPGYGSPRGDSMTPRGLDSIPETTDFDIFNHLPFEQIFK